MSFYAKSFTYNDTPSELYNLQVANVGDASGNSPGSGNIEILEKYIYRKNKPYFYGITYNSRLEFPINFFSENEITAVDASYIQDWLFAQTGYKKFTLSQPDMYNIYFNSIFTNPQLIRYGNIIYGFSATCKCDSQYAYTYPKTMTFDYSSAPSGSTITFYNNSHSKEYLFPSIEFTMDSTGSEISIINTSDSNREFFFTSLSGSEVITVDNERGIVTSSLGTGRLSDFNKNFLRFVPGVNILTLTGGISQLTLTYQFARRLGG